MKLVSIPANPVPEDVVTGTAQDQRRGLAALCALGAAAGRKGTVCLFQGRAEFIEKYYETVRDLRARGFAVATLDWRGQGLSQRAAARSAQGPCRQFLRIRHRSADLHAGSGAAGLPAADLCPWAFHGRRRPDPRRHAGSPLVRPHRAFCADDRAAGARSMRGDARYCQAHAAAGHGRRPTCPAETHPVNARPFVGNVLTLRSGALCAQRCGAGSGARARRRCADICLGGCRLQSDARLSQHAYAAKIRQPILLDRRRPRRRRVDARRSRISRSGCARDRT